MDIFNVEETKAYADLSLGHLNSLHISVYVLTKDWNYIFVNDAVSKNIGQKPSEFIGRNLWTKFPELAMDAAFTQLKTNSEKGINTNIITTSPITGKRLNIKGFVLDDCYLFTSTMLPLKDELLNELRAAIGKHRWEN